VRFIIVCCLIWVSACKMNINGKTIDLVEEFSKKPGKTEEISKDSGKKKKVLKPVGKPIPTKDTATSINAPEVILDPDTSSNPMVIDVDAVKMDIASKKTRFANCKKGSNWMTREPVAKLVIKKRAKVIIQSDYAGLIFGNGRFRCYHASTTPPTSVFTGVYEAGTYVIYPMGDKGKNVATRIKITLVDRIPEIVAKRLDNAPVLEVNDTGSLNPVYHTFETGNTPGYEAGILKMDCARRKLFPVARVSVTSDSTYSFSAPYP